MRSAARNCLTTVASSPPTRGVTASDVERAADALLRAGDRPTIDKIRQKLGTGSPNTINPLLDAWWRKLGARLDAGPAAFHRLPESVAYVAEALWMQALDEGRRRAQLELKSKERTAADEQQTLAVRSHVLTLREGELDSRLRDRETTITALNQQLHDLTLLLRKEQATREAQGHRITALQKQLVGAASSLLERRRPQRKSARARTPPAAKKKKRQTTRAAQLRRPKPTKTKRKSAPPTRKRYQ